MFLYCSHFLVNRTFGVLLNCVIIKVYFLKTSKHTVDIMPCLDVVDNYHLFALTPLGLLAV